MSAGNNVDAQKEIVGTRERRRDRRGLGRGCGKEGCAGGSWAHLHVSVMGVRGGRVSDNCQSLGDQMRCDKDAAGR
jgi:hypothetical protein